MNVAEITASRPSHRHARDEAARRIKSVIERMPAEKTLCALAPFAGSPAEAVGAMFSEADTVLSIALDILELHLDGAEPGSWGSKVSDLVFIAKQRMKCVAAIHEELVVDLAEAIADEVPTDEAPDSQTRRIGEVERESTHEAEE